MGNKRKYPNNKMLLMKSLFFKESIDWISNTIILLGILEL